VSTDSNLIEGRARDLGGGFVVRRVLPAAARQMLGPFIFFDHLGPRHSPPGPAIDVRPHPHIALATVTYLFSGEILHRDSLGSVQEIHPGDVNWMVAGRGIVHSERSTERTLREGTTLHGIQSWVALPDGHEDDAPAFRHHPADTLPCIETPDGVRLRVIAGEALGRRSPAETLWPTLYVDVQMPGGARLELAPEHEERGVYVVEGRIEIDGAAKPRGVGQLSVLEARDTVVIRATEQARLMLIGGQAMPTSRHISWNFVASSRPRIDAARHDWRSRNLQRFPLVPGDEREFIPLPD